MRGRFSWAECSDLSSPFEASESTMEIGSGIFFGQLFIQGEYYEIVQNDGSSLFHLMALSELLPKSKQRRELSVASYHLAANAASCEGIYQTNGNVVSHTDNAQTCANAISADPSLCPSGIFMVASGQPHWNCRCCSSTGWNRHNYWSIYVLDNAVLSTEDFCSTGAVNADPNLCARANCNGTPMCTWSVNHCVRNNAVADQPITQCGTVWQASYVAPAQCSASSEWSGHYGCENAFEENDRQWATATQGVSSWIYYRWDREVTLHKMVFRNRVCPPGLDCGDTKRMRLVFSDGSNLEIEFTDRHGENEILLPGKRTSTVMMWVIETYSSVDNGAQYIRFYQHSDPTHGLKVPSIRPECPAGTIEADVSIITESWAYEIDWFLSQDCQNHNDHYLDYRRYYHHCCVPEQDLQLTCTDSYNDGWHGAKLFINGIQVCRKISEVVPHWMNGRRSLGMLPLPSSLTDQHTEITPIPAAVLKVNQQLDDPLMFAWVMSRWAWMIYSRRNDAASGNFNQDWWKYGSLRAKQGDLEHIGIKQIHEYELWNKHDHPYQNVERFLGGAYVYNVGGSHLSSWSTQSNGLIGVITISGTVATNLADWYADAQSGFCAPLDGFNWCAGPCFAAYGFGKRWSTIKSSVDDAIKAFQDQGIIDIYITGHSLGGAVASIVAAYIRVMTGEWSQRVKLATFGSPRVFCEAEADRLQGLIDNDRFTAMRVVNYNDVVTTVPASWQIGGIDFKHFGKVYTLDSNGLYTNDNQNYQAVNFGIEFLGITSAFVSGLGLNIDTKLAWGAIHDHNAYPQIFDHQFCEVRHSKLCSFPRFIRAHHECANANIRNLDPTQVPSVCMENGKLFRHQVQAQQLPVIPQSGTDQWKMVASKYACEGAAQYQPNVYDGTFNPHVCAHWILANPSSCRSKFFMVAPGYADWGCRCCTGDSSLWTPHQYWNMYKVV